MFSTTGYLQFSTGHILGLGAIVKKYKGYKVFFIFYTTIDLEIKDMACGFCKSNPDWLVCPNCGCSGGRAYPDEYYERNSIYKIMEEDLSKKEEEEEDDEDEEDFGPNDDSYENEILIKIEKTVENISKYKNCQAYVCKEELQVWKKHQRDCSKLTCSDAGEGAHYMQKDGSSLGVYSPRKGYYKFVEVPNQSIHAKSGSIVNTDRFTKSASEVNTTNGDERVLKIPVYAYYDVYSSTNFLEEIVLIEAKPLFNIQSIGPKNIHLKEGMIIQVLKSFVSGDSYQIEWKLL